MTAAIRSCYKAVFQSKANAAPGSVSLPPTASASASASTADAVAAINASAGNPNPNPNPTASAGAGVLVLDDAEKMMKDIEVELADRLKAMNAFKQEKPDVYAAIEKVSVGWWGGGVVGCG